MALRKVTSVYTLDEIKIRNDFAGRAMQEMVALNVHDEDGLTMDSIAKLAYEYADAMVEQSQKDI